MVNRANFDVNKQYALYLQRVKLNESKMAEVQKVETKRAFMGGFLQALFMLRDEIAELEEEEGILYLGKMILQLEYFWENQIK